MNWWDDVKQWASDAWNSFTGLTGSIGNAFTAVWKFVRSVGSSVDYLMTHPISDVLSAGALVAGLLTGNGQATHNALARLVGWTINHPIRGARNYALKLYNLLYAELSAVRIALTIRINRGLDRAHKYTIYLVGVERKRRIVAFRRSEAYTRTQVRAALATIQREAASAYSLTNSQRTDLITRLADVIAARQPELRALVDTLVKGLLDLLMVDDPVLRITLGFVVKHIINRLGIDKAIGALLADLVGPLIDAGRPRDLHGVIASVSSRLGALEAQAAQFMADGGPQILQAGEEWKGLTGIAVDAALLGMFAAMVAAPDAWAKDVASAAGPVVRDSIAAVTAVFGA